MAIGIALFWLSGSIVHAQGETEKRAELRKAGIVLQVSEFNGGESRYAIVDCAIAEPRRVAELLGEARNLIGVTLILTGGNLSEDHVQLIRDLRLVTSLDIQASQLSEKDLERIASLKQLEHLGIRSREISPAHLRPLLKMPHLTRLSLHSANRIAPAALVDFKMLMKEGALTVRQSPPFIFFPDLVSSPDDSPAARLRKEKVNAAMAAIRYIDGKIQAGVKGLSYGDTESLAAARVFKESILDLDDEIVRGKLIDEFVNYLKNAEDKTREMLEAGNLDPVKLPLVRYQYLDAQLMQLQFKKKQ
jgi:hypothetical protein